MNAKDFIQSSRTKLHSFLRSSQRTTKRSAAKADHSPMIFIGSWKLRHSETARTHSLVIGPDLTISIDHRTIPCKVVSLTADTLVLLDHYGYHITITADGDTPVKLFDEADDVIYYIVANANN
ncbi:DUF4828 domain-containing protein [Lactobacillus sp. LC28-10]|uniref:DUF4828 domain-containing protein n=1 Tax=Secundilactobacillus angelensis TaxID=2722706 RepID=A0ABX1KWG1_9LACO|nr:DUF4828 domain-containing protein [Secundilactobacillus angelensis]MCH5462543.1 DUF4828 domain-containing protein [Secundilactobacillus angelensis]NLR18266.1 DUF4828 domain-containing protein [Secundilactobacillus angelensis]